ncbi:uncharacterized protein [Watersipora subatra]|uniref:uncharacterized protein n=1 Tax=Watersipora subatra TaxID=2589382 RepID=UPI00355B0CAD
MSVGHAAWICLAVMITRSMAVDYFQPTVYQICDLNFVNTTVPMGTHVEIHSPNWPAGYQGPYDCSLTVVLPELTWIGFYSIDFTLEQPASGCRDKVTIRTDGKPGSLQTHCGNITAHDIVFYDWSLDAVENVVIRFEASQYMKGTTPEQRFDVQYTVADIIYPGVNHNRSKPVVLNDHGYIVSHNNFGSKDEHYDPFINSFFTLTELEPNTVVEIYFIAFQLHQSGTCADKLTISGISAALNNNNPLELCGVRAHNTVYEVITIGNSITFNFKTDSLSSSQGFYIQYDVKGYWDPDAGYPPNGDIDWQKNRGSSLFSTSKPRGTSSLSVNHMTGTTSRKQKYLALGIGIGAGNCVIIIALVIGIVCFIKRRKKRQLSRDSKRVGFTDSTRSGPLPSPNGYSYEKKKKGNINSAPEVRDDESAYYSEIGTYHKRHERDNSDVHYASRNIRDTHFYHVVEDDKPAAPRVPPTNSAARPPDGPVLKPPSLHKERDFHLPYLNPRQESRFTYTKNNERLNGVQVEYQPQSWQNSQGLQRF